MQFDPLRAFPYPVLRPAVDDYVDADIQVTVEITQSQDLSSIVADIQFVISVQEILAAVERRDAEYVVVFACRDTYFRQAVSSSATVFKHSFAPGFLRGEVQIFPYVVAKRDVVGFACSQINPEFGAGPFAFPKGAALAVDEPQAIYIDRDSFKPISSAFDLVKNDNLPYGEWRIEAGQEKVKIGVNPDLKARIDSARNNNQNKAILLNSIYMGAVIQCVALLKRSSDYDDFRWANIFRLRCEELSIDLKKHDESWVAQQLMKVPFKLVDSYFFGERNEG